MERRRYIGIAKLHTLGFLKNGVMPNYFDGMVAGGGNTVNVPRFKFSLTGPKELERVKLNPNKLSVWKNSKQDIWKQAGVWGYDKERKPVILNGDYIKIRNGQRVNFSEEYFKPFALKYQEALHEIDSTWVIFVEPALLRKLPKFSSSESKQMVNVEHWYNALTLLEKKYTSWVGVDVRKAKPVFGKRAVRKAFHEHMHGLADETKKNGQRANNGR